MTVPSPAIKIDLTEREVSVLRLIANGQPNKAIAVRLGLSEHTIKHHVTHILAALQARDRAHAVGRGFAAGIVSPADVEGAELVGAVR
jgi:DNA-binding NarL/FixJ family response regulator